MSEKPPLSNQAQLAINKHFRDLPELRQPLEFGNAKQVAALRQWEACLEQRADWKAISETNDDGKREFTIKFSGTTTIWAASEQAARGDFAHETIGGYDCHIEQIDEAD